MLPSTMLRKIISKKMKIKLEAYAWDKDLRKSIFNIVFLDGTKKTTLGKIFKEGFNIGNCLLTSYYIATIFDNASICTGKVEILKGSKNSEDGSHVWIEVDNYIVDPTLMIKLPLDSYYAKFYNKQSTITPLVSPYDYNYSIDSYAKKHYPQKYYFDLFDIKNKK